MKGEQLVRGKRAISGQLGDQQVQVEGTISGTVNVSRGQEEVGI